MLSYDPGDYPPFAVTVDLAVFTVQEDRFGLVLVQRGEDPFKGAWALPGGFVRPEENLEAAAARELLEETGMDPGTPHLEQLRSYGDPQRDPRMRVVTVAYIVLAPSLSAPIPGSDASDAEWCSVDEVLCGKIPLAFDHRNIVGDAVERARNKLEYTTLGASFCTQEFTVSELRRVYELVWGRRLDPRNFHRKVTGIPGFLVPTGTHTTRDGGRPALVYRRGGASEMYPPLLREPGGTLFRGSSRSRV